MSNDALNAHIRFGEPCGPDADLSQIADWAGSRLLGENQETEKLRTRVDELTKFVIWIKEITDYAVELDYNGQRQNWIAKQLLTKDWK